MTHASLSNAAQWAFTTSRPLPPGPLRAWFVPRATAKLFQVGYDYPTDLDSDLMEDFLEGLLWNEDDNSLSQVMAALLKMGTPACLALRERLTQCVPDVSAYSPPGSLGARKACRDVVDWLCSLPASRPRLAASAARMERMTFGQAEAASREWHRRMARDASVRRQREREKAATVPDGPDDISEALRVDLDYRWVWLLTEAARVREGKVMGHCVGGAAYSGVRVLSLRNARGMSVATAALSPGGSVSQATGPGNGPLGTHEHAALERLVQWLAAQSTEPAVKKVVRIARDAYPEGMIDDFVSGLLAA